MPWWCSPATSTPRRRKRRWRSILAGSRRARPWRGCSSGCRAAPRPSGRSHRIACRRRGSTKFGHHPVPASAMWNCSTWRLRFSATARRPGSIGGWSIETRLRLTFPCRMRRWRLPVSSRLKRRRSPEGASQRWKRRLTRSSYGSSKRGRRPRNWRGPRHSPWPAFCAALSASAASAASPMCWPRAKFIRAARAAMKTPSAG